MFPFSLLRRSRSSGAAAPTCRPRLEALEDRLVPANIRIVGVDQGPPHVAVFAGDDSRLIASFFAFDPAFQGGVRVGIADVNGDGVQDYICGAGPGAQAHVKVIDGARANEVQPNGQIADSALLASFIAFDPTIRSGVFVAGGNLDGDRPAEVAVGTAEGTAGRVRVFDVAPGLVVSRSSGPLGDFFPYGAGFQGGITLVAANLDGKGPDELVTGTFRGSSHLKAFDAVTGAEQISLLAYPGFTGGFSVSTFDVNGDGRDDIITGGAEGAGGHIKILDGVTGQETSSYFGMGPGYNGGTRVAISVSARGVTVWGGTNPRRPALINSSDPVSGTIVNQVVPFDGFAGGVFLASSRTA
jgi:hypothetical protein